MKRRKAVVKQSECVACGCCAKVCPKKAVYVIKGVFAEVKRELCVGCGKCMTACPASVISMEEIEYETK